MSNKRDMVIMFGDIEVMKVNFSTRKYDIINKEYLPYGLRGKISKIPKIEPGMTEDDISKYLDIATENYSNICAWLADRVLLLSRSNAKLIYNALNFEQSDSPLSRAKVAITCRAISLLDNYWIKLDGDNTTWSKVNLRHNSLNEIVTQIALHGKSLTFQGSYNTPELTTNGVYAKAWRRHNDGKLWLHKLSNNGNQSEIEVMVSNILDKCNVPHVRYKAGKDEGKYVCMCPCISDDNRSIVTAHEYMLYCKTNHLNFMDEVFRIDSDNYYKMHIVDYLISNTDRHSYNWGFYVDNKTLQLISLHPLFDHNDSFKEEWMKNKDGFYKCNGKGLRESAVEAMKYVDFHFTDSITRDMFIDYAQYRSFTERATELGIKTVKAHNMSFDDAINVMGGI